MMNIYFTNCDRINISIEVYNMFFFQKLAAMKSFVIELLFLLNKDNIADLISYQQID